MAQPSPEFVIQGVVRPELNHKTSNADQRESKWLDEYLLGFAADWESTAGFVLQLESGDPVQAYAAHSERGVIDARAHVQRQAARRALEHYTAMLEIRPDSYWGNYRAAVACFALEEFDKAAEHLERCLKRRPDNPVLHGVRAGCLAKLGDFRALDEANLAIKNAPEKAEWYRSRAFIRSAWQQTAGVSEDIENFELLSNLLPRSFWGQNTGATQAGGSHRSATPSVLGFPAALAAENRFGESTASGKATWKNGEIDPEELSFRVFFASTLREADEPALAEVELGKILALDPDHIGARVMRARRLLEADRLDEAFPDLELVLNHPGLLEYLRNEPVPLARIADPNKSLVIYLHYVSRHYCRTRPVRQRTNDRSPGTRSREAAQPVPRRISLQLGDGPRPRCPDRTEFYRERCRTSSTGHSPRIRRTAATTNRT